MTATVSIDEQRRAQLVAAAHAVCSWVHAQQAARHAVPVAAFTLLRPMTPAPVAVAATAPVAEPTAPAPFPFVDELPVPVAAPAMPSIDVLAHLRHAVAAALQAARTASDSAVRFWRPALASLAVIAVVGMARTSWPRWSTTIRTQLAAAGEHVSVFDRPVPAAAIVPAAPAKSERPGASRRAGQLHVDSEPVGAQVIIDGKDRGVTPLTVNDLAVGAHAVQLKSDKGSVQRTITVNADKTTQLNEAIYAGWLHVSSGIDLQLSDNGKGLRLDDSNQALLSPGPHELRFENRRFGFIESRHVDIRPGETSAIAFETPMSTLSVTATTAAEVFVDGSLVGQTPLANYALPVGIREVLVRNAAGLEKRSTVTVTVQPVTLDVEFGH